MPELSISEAVELEGELEKEREAYKRRVAEMKFERRRLEFRIEELEKRLKKLGL